MNVFFEEIASRAFFDVQERSLRASSFAQAPENKRFTLKE